MENCGESALEKAGECFSLAGCCKLVAEVYAKGNHFSKCLSVCKKAKLLDVGWEYIQNWKKDVTGDGDMIETEREISKIKQEFLESSALHYHGLNDRKVMMKFVQAFDSMTSKRTFLKSLGCLDELLSLEEESGNFLEAADIAKLRGKILLGADLLEKGGHFKDASMLILWYVFANSLWAAGSKGWPLKQFTQKEELLTKAKSLAERTSRRFYKLVCTEVSILSNEQIDLFVMKQHLNSSQRCKNIRGEILSARKILDAHLDLNTSKYVWEEELVGDVTRPSEDKLHKQVSVETLVYFWNFWKDKIVNIYEYLKRLENEDVNEYNSYGEFCLNYFGVWRQFNDLNACFLSLNPDADWLRKLDYKSVRENRKLVSFNVCQFVSAACSYWCSELLSVGMKVLKNLEALYNFSIKNSLSVFCQSSSLTHIYEVATFLLKSKFPDNHYHDARKLQKYVGLSTEHIFGCVFPQEWRESLRENMISLRGMDIARNLLEGVISQNISSKNNLTYRQIGRIALVILGSCKLNEESYKKAMEGLNGNLPWKAFIENLCGLAELESLPEPSTNSIKEVPREVSLVRKFHGALSDAYSAIWAEEDDPISPDSFLYLVERHLILLSSFQGYFFTLKSSFVEWLIYQEGKPNPTSSSVTDVKRSFGDILKFLGQTVEHLIYKERKMIKWIKKSHINVKDSHSVLVLRLVVIICLLHLNFGKFLYLISILLGRDYITRHLPKEFCEALQRCQKRTSSKGNVNVIAEAFKKIGNPLVIVNLGGNCPNFECADAIFIDMKNNQCKEDILGVLFPRTAKASQVPTGVVNVEGTNSCKELFSPNCYDQGTSSMPSNSASATDQDFNTQNITGAMNHGRIWEIFEALESVDCGRDQRSIMSNVQKLRGDVEKAVQLLTAAWNGWFQKNPTGGDKKSFSRELASMLDDLKQLCTALTVSEPNLENSMSKIRGLLKTLQSRKRAMEPFLNQLFSEQDANHTGEASASGDHYDKEGSSNSKTSKGKMKVLQTSVASGTKVSNQEMDSKEGGNNRKIQEKQTRKPKVTKQSRDG